MIAGPPSLDDYTSLITSEFQADPDFMAVVAAEIQPFVDIAAIAWSMLGMFSPEATGDQLDKFAAWVGVKRNLPNPVDGLTVLPDASFQILVRLAIAMNGWDGTIPGAYSIWQSTMGPTGITLLIQDNQDCTLAFIFSGITDAVTKALILGGYFNLVPGGCRAIEYAQPSVANTPVFGWGAESDTVAGWGTGCWIEPLQ